MYWKSSLEAGVIKETVGTAGMIHTWGAFVCNGFFHSHHSFFASLFFLTTFTMFTMRAVI